MEAMTPPNNTDRAFAFQSRIHLAIATTRNPIIKQINQGDRWGQPDYQGELREYEGVICSTCDCLWSSKEQVSDESMTSHLVIDGAKKKGRPPFFCLSFS
jgi:hypothetical protein